MLYGSQQDCTAMSPCDRSQGKGQFYLAVVPKTIHPSRLVYGSQSSYAAMPMRFRSQGKGYGFIAEMPRNKHPSRPVLESQGSVAEMPMRGLSQGKGHHGPAEMPFMVHPSQPVYGSRYRYASMPHLSRSHQFMGGSEVTHSNVTGIAPSHQLGKDIICTLIKPLLFLPFLLIYGSHPLCAEIPTVPRSHQIWATSKTPQGQRQLAQYNQRPSTTRSNATT